MNKPLGQPSPLLCLCAHVTEREIVEAVERGADDLPAVREATGANTGCGDCAHDIEDLMSDCRERSAARTTHR
ncbi:(2Fe-2S)-binding protein [Streptomyces ficellus]|uniref:(2Fe-2S)-binding protein n=1 Tax=Streptomyces ficellus TaxID=1977088 RepID=A0ABT7Z673_9ACTN|nr:(2Fe-2S)-binding protein [Streptomyces ficellus]MDN3294953.1 (2Fe-2S)-binding protein [Streptomyces ficellus]